MFRRNILDWNIAQRHNFHRTCAYVVTLLTIGLLTACGTNHASGTSEISGVDTTEPIPDEDTLSADTVTGTETTASSDTENDTVQSSQTDPLRKQFGTLCISEQTFEVELSEYKGNVWFVPYAPSGDDQTLRIQIIQDGEVLADLYPYVPEWLEGTEFTSLDAVAFFDVNYDGCTDIVLIETYDNTSFAAIYYGFAADGDDYEKYFLAQEQLSENVTSKLETLTIPEIRSLVTQGKKNGSFTCYQEAYETISSLSELESSGSLQYNLIYFDEDDIPELVTGVEGYYISLYTYHDGTVYPLMDAWAYGAMGNAGYEYVPGQNSLRNYNADFAGAILNTAYMRIGAQHSWEMVAYIETYNFDDVNENGIPDENERDSIGCYSVSYMDGKEVSPEECASYDAGEYEYITPVMDIEELLEALQSP